MDRPLVLVVEDEPLILEDIEEFLTDAGYEVEGASSGEKAIEKFDAKSTKIRAVVTDIRLGRGLNGWCVGAHARRAVPSIAVVYMTGDSAHEWRSLGVTDSIMIPKPFVMGQLATAISMLLNDPDQAST